jgi:hypothetical protein
MMIHGGVFDSLKQMWVVAGAHYLMDPRAGASGG